MGKRRGFGGPTSSTFITWDVLVLLHQPVVVIHKNVCGFDIATLASLLASVYTCDCVTLDPLMFGWPVARARRYTVFTLRTRAELERSVQGITEVLQNGVGDGTGDDLLRSEMPLASLLSPNASAWTDMRQLVSVTHHRPSLIWRRTR